MRAGFHPDDGGVGSQWGALLCGRLARRRPAFFSPSSVRRPHPGDEEEGGAEGHDRRPRRQIEEE
jgi:hypothetical protein